VSFLISEGHGNAKNYPLSTLWSECRIAQQRNALSLQREMMLMQMVVGSIFSAKMSKELQRVLKELPDGY